MCLGLQLCLHLLQAARDVCVLGEKLQSGGEVGDGVREVSEEAVSGASSCKCSGLDAVLEGLDVVAAGSLPGHACEQAESFVRGVAVALDVIGAGSARDVHLHVEDGVV